MRGMKSFNIKIAAALLLVLVILVYVGLSSQSSRVLNAYEDKEIGFSIDLPKGWEVASKEVSNTVSSTWFNVASSSNASVPSVQFAVERFKRTPDMNKIIGNFGTGPFVQGLIESLWVDLGLDIKKNESVKIGDKSFVHIYSTYVGKGTKKEVTQHMYFIFTDLYYYRIGVDVYTDDWAKIGEEILKSVQTFKIL